MPDTLPAIRPAPGPAVAVSPESDAVARAFTYRDLGRAVVAEWLDTLPSPHTRRAYRSDLKALADWLAAHRSGAAIEDMTVADMRAWAKHLHDSGLKRSTRHRRLSTVSALFEYLLASGSVRINPAHPKLVKRPDIKRADDPTPLLSTDELAALFDGCRTAGPRTALIVHLGAVCGLRSAEITALTVSDVLYTPPSPRLRVHRKGGGVSFIDIDDDVCAVLADWMEAREKIMRDHGRDPDHPDSPVVCGMEGDRAGLTVTPVAVSRAVNRFTRKVLGRVVGEHALRKSGATFLYTSGGTIKELMEWGGWQSLSTAKRYVEDAERGHHPGKGLAARIRAASAEGRDPE